MLLIDGKIVGSADQGIELTQEEYNALSESEKNNGTVYYIKDGSEGMTDTLSHIENVIGNEYSLETMGYSTIVEAINGIYNKIKGFTFQLDPITNTVNIVYDDTEPTPGEIPELPQNANYEQKMEHVTTVIGSETDLTTIGYSSIIDALRDIHSRLDGITFTYNEADGTVDITYEKV